MAERWYVGEARNEIKIGNKKARNDIAARFPLFATATDDEIFSVFSEDKVKVTVRQVEIALRGGAKGKVDFDEEDEDDGGDKMKEKNKGKSKKKEKKSKKKKVKKEKDEDLDDEDLNDDEEDDVKKEDDGLDDLIDDD